MEKSKTLTSLNYKELSLKAKSIGLKGYSKLNKSDLVYAILEAESNVCKTVVNQRSWWVRFHNHVYGVIGIIGTFMAVVFYFNPIVEERSNSEIENIGINTRDVAIPDQGIERYAPSYLEVTRLKTKPTNLDNVASLEMTIGELYENGRKIRESGIFSAIEDFKYKVDGKWIDWEGSVVYASRAGGMGWDYDVLVKSLIDESISSSLLFHGEGWQQKVLSLRKGDYISYSGRIHQVEPGYTVSVNVYDFTIVLEDSNHGYTDKTVMVDESKVEDELKSDSKSEEQSK